MWKRFFSKILFFGVLFFIFIFSLIYYKGELIKMPFGGAFLKQRKQVSVPPMPRPNVDGRILLLGDSHLAIHPWHEYSSLPFSNRSVAGSRIRHINIERIEGSPALVVICTSTNDLQSEKPLSIGEIKVSLKSLFDKVKNKWRDSTIIYISAPYPNVELYEKYIRPASPKINRPMPEQIDAIRYYVSSLGIITLQAKSANIDGIHLDPESVAVIVDEITKIFTDKMPDYNSLKK